VKFRGSKLTRSVALVAVLAMCGSLAAPRVRAETTVENGYEITRSQSVTPAPHGYVGRKTTDRETRTGVVPDETWGNSTEFVMTIGGWAKQCPTSEGMVQGVFEYVVTKNDTISDDDGTRRTSYSHRLTARLKGKVTDDSRLEYVEIEGEFMRQQDGATEFRNLAPTRFSPGASGEPDWSAMRRTVEVTAELSWATAILMMGVNYKAAEAEWNKLSTRCIEFTFDPPTETRSLGSEETIEVRPKIRTTGESGALVSKWGPFASSIKNGGTLLPPRDSSAASIDPPVIKYKAAAQPKQGHGFSILAKSRAGVGEGEWKIIDPGFEGTFSYTDTGDWGVVVDTTKITGRLVWKPENQAPPSSTFGDHKSSFFRPSDGQITVEIQSKSRGHEGSSDCQHSGSKTFAVSSLARGALRHMLLEVADDGRYKLTFVIPDRPDPFPPWDIVSVCTFPNASANNTRPVRMVSLVLGLQQGKLDPQQSVIGKTQAPIQRGPRKITGSWSFKRIGQR
jgi:hypothetical protein